MCFFVLPLVVTRAVRVVRVIVVVVLVVVFVVLLMLMVMVVNRRSLDNVRLDDDPLTSTLYLLRLRTCF